MDHSLTTLFLINSSSLFSQRQFKSFSSFHISWCMASTALERGHMFHYTDDHFRSHSNEPDHCLIRDNALDIIVIQPVVLSIDSHLGRASGLNNRQNGLPTMYSNPNGHPIESYFTETALSPSLLELEAHFLFECLSNLVSFQCAVLSLNCTTS